MSDQVEDMSDQVEVKVSGSGDMPTTKVEEILERMRNAAGVSSNKQLAEFMGLDPQVTTSAKKRGEVPSIWLVKISARTNISIDWLLYGEGPMRRGEKIHEDRAGYGCLSPEDFGIIPLLESWLAAGPDGEVIYDGIADRYPFKRFWLDRLVGKSDDRIKKLFLLKVHGDSMSPTINRGELILVDTFEAERTEIKVGSIYIVVQPDGKAVLKRLAVSERAGRISLICMSDNIAAYKAFEFELDPQKSILEYVLGRVRWAGKEFD
jgi:phage repressor protein C with HTH and peptisase S24 domain